MPAEQKKDPAPRKSAVVGIVGRTNAGKSSLVNRLVGEKISIVSPVEQTTRNTIRGIVEDPRGQLVLLDTPGLHKAEGRLGRLLNSMARASSAQTDIIAVVFDASRPPQMEDEGWMARICRERRENAVFVLNKSDRSPFYETMFRDAWKALVSASGKSDSTPVSPVWVKSCAVKPGGTDALLDALFAMAQEGEDLFPSDISTDYPRKLAIADSIREKFLRFLHDELPHEIGIIVNSIHESGNVWDVAADIYVNRRSQKAIVIGKGASNLANVRRLASSEISKMFGVKVNLELWVKVEPDWMKNSSLLSEMGCLGQTI